jgi:hypothetical protein
MKLAQLLTRIWLLRLLVCAVAVSALLAGVRSLQATSRAESFAAVGLTGVHHMGDKFNVPQFFVDGYYGSNVGREGGGGSDVCCVSLPRRWRPGLSVEVRWAVDDFTHEKPAEVEVGNFDSVVGGGTFIAQVPVERYEPAEHLWVHFFPGGKVRVISSMPGSGGPKHPIQDNDPHAIDTATAGRRVAALFSAAEIAEMERKDAERRSKYGDWR